MGGGASKPARSSAASAFGESPSSAKVIPTSSAKRPVEDTLPRLLQERTQVLELVEEVPDVILRALVAMRMQVGELGVGAVTVEGLLGGPFHQDENGARLDVAGRRLTELPQRHHAAAMRLDLPCGASRVREVFVLVGDVEEIEGVDRLGHWNLLERQCATKWSEPPCK